MRRRAIFTLLTIGAILLLLIALFHYLVVRPVRQLERAAQAVGQGDLSRTIARANARGDELARLGSRFNEMVEGLRAKMHLEKFVSRGTAAAAHDAGLDGVGRQGERLETTVLFSDIRGFTAYSEKVDPEEVVDMLNHLLRAQADVVHRYDGDIDKFVGDELMALFHGDDAQERAVRCAVEMLDAVDEAHRSELGIGVGISAGPVVYGAIGHEERMDFTVIGDVVNTGARLCSAAPGGTVLVTEEVRSACGECAGIAFEALEPLEVKGKSDALTVFAAKRSGDASDS
jgi:adenylate cyclase